MEFGKGFGGVYFGWIGLIFFGYGSMLFGGVEGGQGKVCMFEIYKFLLYMVIDLVVVIYYLICCLFSIGKWIRVGQNIMDFIVFYFLDKCIMIYYINNEQVGYKIEYFFLYIKNIFFENSEGDLNKFGGIVIEFN